MTRRRRHHLTRRAFLGGASAMIALPFLETFAPARRAYASESGPPQRFLAYYVPNGIHMPAWTPDAQGRDFDLPRILAPLEDVREHITVLSNLANRPGQPDGPGDHAAGTASFLTATHVYKTEGANIQNGVSIDQILAQNSPLTTDTRLPSLQLGTEGGGNAGGCDSGYSCAYSRNISWAGPATPLPKIVRPQLVFDRLFEGYDAQASAAELEKRRLYRRSILDLVRGDANSLKTRLGRTDRSKLDEYLTGIRELELRIQDAEQALVCDVPDRPVAYIDFPNHVQLMNELMILAFQCDLTRVVTFMLNNAGSGRSYGFLGDFTAGAHHETSHHQNDPDNFERLQQIGTWEVAQFADLVARMAAVDEGEGTTMLDNTLLFFSSEISDGNRHNHDNLPVLLAGSAKGNVTPGRHVAYANEEPIADLFIAFADMFGVPMESFGDNGTRVLSGLTA